MNGPNRSATFRNGQPIRRGSPGVMDELDAFVDSEPSGWSPLRAAEARSKADSRDEEPTAREERREPAFSKRRRPSGSAHAPIAPKPSATSQRMDAFTKRLDEQLSEPSATKAPPPPDVAAATARFAAPPAAEPREPRREPDVSDELEFDAPHPPELQDEPGLPPVRTSEAPSSRIPPAPPIMSLSDEPEPDHAGDANLGDIDIDTGSDEPADALDWEFKNAFSAIVAGNTMPKAEPDVGAGLPAGPDAQPEREPPRQQLPETQRPAERALKPVISERKPKSVPLFRFARQDDAERFDPAIPTDTDELIDSLYFPDARSALDEARPDTATQPITSELYDEDHDDDFVYDEAEAEEGILSDNRRGRSRRRGGMRSIGLASIVACVAVVGVAGVIGFNVFANGGDTADEPPPIIRADARDVKVRADNSQPQAEPDILERTAVREGGELVVPDRVSIPPSRQATPLPDDTDALERRRVQTVVVRPDGTLVPASSSARDAAARRAAASASETVETGTAQVVRDVGAADSLRGIEAQSEEVRVAALPSNNAADPIEPLSPTRTETAPAEIPAAVEQAAEPQVDPTLIGVPRRRPAAPPASRQPARSSGPVDLAQQRAAAPPVQTASRAPAASTSSSLPWAVQVSSQRSRGEAERSFRGLQQRYPGILGGVDPMILQANVAGRGVFYRVRIGANSRAEAANLCQRLKSAGADCFIGRN